MPTKYILVGGYPRKASDGGKAFAEELVKGFSEPVRVLLCYFARPKYQWPVNFVEDREFFWRHLGGRKLEFEIADENKFTEQVKNSDAIYIRGGRTNKALELLKNCPGWDAQLSGKTLAGSSAGAEVIAKYHYNLDNLQLGQGLGLVPVKVLPHYKSNYNSPNIDWDKSYQELKDYKEDLPVLTLAEGQFEVR